jgi:UDP-GlcNAc:undecaprenyl-phosphate GlcNAc-1-phosphate transferase
MPDIGWYGLVLVIAAVATAALTVPAKRIALRVGYVAHPGERTVHTKPIPYGGGAAMFMGFMVAVLGAAAIPQLRQIFTDSPEMTGVVLAAGAMFAVGLIDDVRDMSAPAKMAGQVLAASILYFSGVTMYELKIPLAGFFVLTPGIVPLITAAWVIALTNAVNLIDGLDGLAAGVVAIGGGALAIYGIRLMGLGLLPSDNIGPLVAVIACGICLGFPTSTRRASSWVTPAPTSWAC